MNTISGNNSLLRNADVGHMLELREKLAETQKERDDAFALLSKCRGLTGYSLGIRIEIDAMVHKK